MDHMNQNGKLKRPSIFLCLSGGGFRATLFHYGCLKRLNEFGILGQVSFISATSGGSITAACLSQCNNGVDTDAGVYLYDWPKFERMIFNLVTNGVLGHVTKLVWAYIFYAISMISLIALYVFELHGLDDQLIRVGVGLLLFGIFLNALSFAALYVYLSGLTILFSHFICNFTNNIDVLSWAGLCSFLIGFGLHAWLIVDVCFGNAFVSFKKNQEKLVENMQKSGAGNVIKAYNWTFRIIKTCFQPSFLRIETMNAMAFKGETLGMQVSGPKIFYTAVNLNDGLEMVFDNEGIFSLEEDGPHLLWKGARPMKMHEEIELATAVAASSAFPPIFRPVPIKSDNELLGVFADGGVLDNLAVKVPEAFSLHIHPSNPHYAHGTDGRPPFKDIIEFVLVLDGSKPLVDKKPKSWSRITTLFRIIDVVGNAHVSDLTTATLNFRRNAGIGAAAVGLCVGFPIDYSFHETYLSELAKKVRTHLDAFNLQECALLAYCGYSWIDYLVNHEPNYFGRFTLRNDSEVQSFKSILPKYLGTWKDDNASLTKTLQSSHLRCAPIRWLRRIIF